LILPEKVIRILFIGDIVGEEGLDLTLDLLPRLRRNSRIDFILANGENLDRGKGLSELSAQKLLNAGVRIITTGNHIWDSKEADRLLTRSLSILRPHNYPNPAPGSGVAHCLLNTDLGITVINLQGLSFMRPIRCPFTTIAEILDKPVEKQGMVIVDFHAESSAEKQALAWYVDGKVSAVIGTHTHVQTADERILPRGTGYITDAGMTGPSDGVIGMDREIAIKRFIEHRPYHYRLATGNVRFNGVLLECGTREYKTLGITRLNFSKAEYNRI
jgi:metallophosphoesterase (TIGR00282 family)